MAETKEYWSLTEGVFNCLFDQERTEAFQSAIQKTVASGDVVVDMGTGSGVLAMFAARAGASRVYAVEFDENNVRSLRETFLRNGLDQIITVIPGDIRSVQLPEKVNVIIGEMIATGLIEEQQIQANNNMLRNAQADAKVLLKKYTSFLDLVDNNEHYYGLEFPITRYEYPGEDKLRSRSYSERIKYAESDFMRIIEDNDRLVHFDQSVGVTEDGVINGLRISSETEFFDGSTFWGSFAYSYPIVLPIERAEVSRGDVLLVRLSYTLCGGFNTLTYSVEKTS